MNHPLRALKRAGLAALGACALILLGAAASARPGDPALYPAHPDAPTVRVYVVYNSFHSGLTVPTADLIARGGPVAKAAAGLRPEAWTSLGWGDAKFYQHEGLGPARIADFFRSMLWPGNPSVMHLAGVTNPTQDASHPKMLLLRLSREGFRRLVTRVDASFALRNGRPMFVARGSGPNDLFFQGAGAASVLHECNQWVGGLLGAAGVPHTPVLDAASDGLGLDLKLRAGAVSAAGGQAHRVDNRAVELI